MPDPVNLAAERAKRRPTGRPTGRPLTPAGHLDAAALNLIDARAGLHALAGGLADTIRRINTDLVNVDASLRHLRDHVGGKAAA